MVSRLDNIDTYIDVPDCVLNKINELCDIINTIQKEREAERFEIQEWIGILEAVRKSVNIHEKQIDELQMKVKQIADHKIRSTNERLRLALEYAIDVIEKVAKMANKHSREYGETLIEQIDNIQMYCWQEGYILTHKEELDKAIKEKKEQQ